jgi:uncharacterized membrane protein HdeD (DUF308 family)
MNSFSNSLLWRGILALIIGVIAIAWPGVTVFALVVLFAIAAFSNGFLEAATGFSSDGAGAVAGHLLLALVDVAAGVAALAWPGITAYVLTIFIGVWAVVGGIAEGALAFAAGESGGQRALLGLGGLVSIAFGIVLFARPDIGAVSLALLFGLFSLAYGISSLVTSATVRDTGGILSGVAG